MTAKTFHNLSKISQWPQMQMLSREEERDSKREKEKEVKRESVREREREIAKEREPVYRLVSSWSGVNCE